MHKYCIAAVMVVVLSLPACAAKSVQRLEIDWAGPKATLILGAPNEDGLGDAGSITLLQPGKPAWKNLNKIDNWLRLNPVATRKLPIAPDWQHQHSFIFAAVSHGKARNYLVLVGGGYGCCFGSVTILTPGPDGAPKRVFSKEEFSIDRIFVDATGTIQIAGRHSMFEVVGLPQEKGATYDPFELYRLSRDRIATYDLAASKTYNETHYCAWGGPHYSEKLVAVGEQDGKEHCRVMSEDSFENARGGK